MNPKRLDKFEIHSSRFREIKVVILKHNLDYE